MTSPVPEAAPAPPAGRRPIVGPVVALVLSVVVLPGLGQMLTGRLARGAVMAGAMALWVPVALIKVGRDLSRIMPDLMARAAEGEALSLGDIQRALAPEAGGLTWVFAPLAIIWLWTLADSIVYMLRQRGK